jgi:hypothetical protein
MNVLRSLSSYQLLSGCHTSSKQATEVMMPPTTQSKMSMPAPRVVEVWISTIPGMNKHHKSQLITTTFVSYYVQIPVIPHKAVAEVSKLGNL